MTFPEKFTIQWIKDHYHTGELTPHALIEEIIKRSKQTLDKNIWIIPPSMEFIQPFLDALPEERGPLWGIPFTVKDNIDMAGIVTTAACPAFAYTAKEDAAVIEKLLQAGAIPIGKANMEQLATGQSGTRSPYGEVHNAYQPELITGGSSSGSAVSVAVGLAPFALGSDTGGSGRGPASFNGLVGYKPPLGSWSGRGVVPCSLSLDTVSVLTNNLADAILVNDVVKGVDPAFLYTRPFDKIAPKLPKKILLPTKKPNFFGPWADVYERKWMVAVARIKKLGIPIETVDEGIFEEASHIYINRTIGAERWSHFKDFTNENPGALLPVVEEVFRSAEGPDKTAANVFQDLHDLKVLKKKTEAVLEGAVFVWPTVGGTYTREQVRQDPIKKNNQIGAYVYFCNLLDLVGVSLPENPDDKEYPFGITMYALAHSEDIMCYAAGKFMART